MVMTLSEASLMLQESFMFASDFMSCRGFFNLLAVPEVPEHQIHHGIIKMQKALATHVCSDHFLKTCTAN